MPIKPSSVCECFHPPNEALSDSRTDGRRFMPPSLPATGKPTVKTTEPTTLEEALPASVISAQPGARKGSFPIDLTCQFMEYRERTVCWDPDGSVEMYMSSKRDFAICLTRLRKTGIEPVKTEELHPGYIILLSSDQASDFTRVIAPRRRPTLSEEERRARSQRMLRVREAAST